MQVLLNVIKAEHLLDGVVLKHHIVVDPLMLFVILLNGSLDQLQSGLVVLARRVAKIWGRRCYYAWFKHNQAVRLLVKHLCQLLLLRLILLVSDKTVGECAVVRVEPHGEKEDQHEVAHHVIASVDFVCDDIATSSMTLIDLSRLADEYILRSKAQRHNEIEIVLELDHEEHAGRHHNTCDHRLRPRKVVKVLGHGLNIMCHHVDLHVRPAAAGQNYCEQTEMVHFDKLTPH